MVLEGYALVFKVIVLVEPVFIIGNDIDAVVPTPIRVPLD